MKNVVIAGAMGFIGKALAKELAGADAAFYLVHSMLPSARLTQVDFKDMNLISFS
jgi:nucleoside-diphosphate-sugar epimerase